MNNRRTGIIVENYDELLGLTQKWKGQGEKVVFTNGCFDILHAGHVDYLQKAAELGDRMIVALNSDASVSRLKGEHRPINSEEHRKVVLSALRCVDAVVVFEEDTPLVLISKILPDVLVKGADYKSKEVVGAKEVKENGGELVLVDFVYSISTSKIEERIKKS